LLVLLSGCATSAVLPEPALRADGMAVITRADYGWPLRTLDNRPVTLGDYRGRVVFLNLWATWCPPCVAELRSIAALRDSMAGEDIAFLLVSPERAEPVLAFLRQQQHELPVLLEDGRMPDSFGLRALPTTFVISPEGDVVLRHRGAADWNNDAVRRLLRALGGTARTHAARSE
jgi:thiol-disulfide isomerase/thioredoxin